MPCSVGRAVMVAGTVVVAAALCFVPGLVASHHDDWHSHGIHLQKCKRSQLILTIMYINNSRLDIISTDYLGL